MKYSRYFLASVGLFLYLVSATSYGFTLTFTDQQLNTFIATMFPQQRVYENITFTFSDPSVSTDPINDEITVGVTVLAVQGGDQLHAKAEISGQLAYHNQLSQLQIKQPALSDITILDNQSSVSDTFINSVKRLKNKRFPVILLVDFEQLDMAAFGLIKPKSIDITRRGILIEL